MKGSFSCDAYSIKTINKTKRICLVEYDTDTVPRWFSCDISFTYSIYIELNTIHLKLIVSKDKRTIIWLHYVLSSMMTTKVGKWQQCLNGTK